MTSQSQPSRAELLARGRQKLQQSRKQSSKQQPQTLPVQQEQAQQQQQYHHSHYHQHVPPREPIETPRRDLLSFLDAAVNEPSTPPSASFTHHASHVPYKQGYSNGHSHQPQPFASHDPYQSSTGSDSGTQPVSMTAAEQAEAIENSLMTFNPLHQPPSQPQHQDEEYNPYASDASDVEPTTHSHSHPRTDMGSHDSVNGHDHYTEPSSMVAPSQYIIEPSTIVDNSQTDYDDQSLSVDALERTDDNPAYNPTTATDYAEPSQSSSTQSASSLYDSIADALDQPSVSSSLSFEPQPSTSTDSAQSHDTVTMDGEQYYDPSAIQYYYDENNNIFHYDPVTGQPVYYQHELSNTDAGTDANTISDSVSASHLATLTALTNEIDNLRLENDRLQSLTRSLQSNLRNQSVTVTELTEDNIRLVQEFETVCERMKHYETIVSESRHDSGSGMDRQAEVSTIGGVNESVSHDATELFARYRDSLELTNQIQQHFQSLTHHLSSRTDPHIASTNGSGDDVVLESAASHLSTLLLHKWEMESQTLTLVTRLRDALDPLALILGQSDAQPPAQAQSKPHSQQSSSPSPVDTSLVPALQSKIAELQSQVSAQQERAAALIKDKILLAKRIEDSVEEKTALIEQLREQIDELGREKQQWLEEREQLLLAHSQPRHLSQPMPMTPQYASHHSYYTNVKDDVPERGSMYAQTPQPPASLPLPQPVVSKPRSLSHPTARPRPRAQPKRGVLSSLWSFIFGSSTAPIESSDGGDEERGDESTSRVLAL